MSRGKEKINSEIEKCIEVLKQGGTILYPTDTIWGLGCDATNDEAVKKIFEIKQRETSKSLITLLDNETKLGKYVKNVPVAAWDLIEFSTKPLTIVYPGVVNLSKLVIAEDGTAAIRITRDEFCKQLIYKFQKPVVSTSANISGDPSPQGFHDISDNVLNAVDYIVNLPGEGSAAGKPSTIVKLGIDGTFEFIRK